MLNRACQCIQIWSAVQKLCLLRIPSELLNYFEHGFADGFIGQERSLNERRKLNIYVCCKVES